MAKSGRRDADTRAQSTHAPSLIYFWCLHPLPACSRASWPVGDVSSDLQATSLGSRANSLVGVREEPLLLHSLPGARRRITTPCFNMVDPVFMTSRPPCCVTWPKASRGAWSRFSLGKMPLVHRTTCLVKKYTGKVTRHGQVSSHGLVKGHTHRAKTKGLKHGTLDHGLRSVPSGSALVISVFALSNFTADFEHQQM